MIQAQIWTMHLCRQSFLDIFCICFQIRGILSKIRPYSYLICFSANTMKKLLLSGFTLMILQACSIAGDRQRSADIARQAKGIDSAKLKKQAVAAFAFCKKHGYDTLNCILIDMSVHSGNNRFMVWDFSKDTMSLAGLVSHGCGPELWGKDHTKETPVFSNADNSHCSSLGKYKIGARGYSQWGIKVNYLLHGLEKTNSNALGRAIVLHSWEDVPDEELYPRGTPEGWGCPAVSNALLKKVDDMLRNKSRPVLLWIYL